MQFQFVPLFMFTLISWLRWCIPDFFIVKLLFFLFTIFCEVVFWRLCRHLISIKLLLVSFMEFWFPSAVVLKLKCAWESLGGLVKTWTAGPHLQSSWSCSFGVGPENSYFYQVSRWCCCCYPRDHTLSLVIFIVYFDAQIFPSLASGKLASVAYWQIFIVWVLLDILATKGVLDLPWTFPSPTQEWAISPKNPGFF